MIECRRHNANVQDKPNKLFDDASKYAGPKARSAWNIYLVTVRRTENLKTLTLGELFGILSAYQMELDVQESKTSHVSSGSAALYAPINNLPYQSCQPIYHPTSTPTVTFPETSILLNTHSNPLSNPTPLPTSGQGAFMAEETNTSICVRKI
ncbi:hypothetical protein E3N88_12775 [Mikania micrantha]|uniref:Uncharacterized protein n=1 Tax=Mikania micrantha TaxID=192012 RepID=A0A5N6P9F3_9ASTR|nr:hypothetical protein E3N88_12775 [Mikania micrantha]